MAANIELAILSFGRIHGLSFGPAAMRKLAAIGIGAAQFQSAARSFPKAALTTRTGRLTRKALELVGGKHPADFLAADSPVEF